MAAIHDTNFVKFEKNDLIRKIYGNFERLLSNFVASCRHIIHTKFHQNQTEPDRAETTLKVS